MHVMDLIKLYSINCRAKAYLACRGSDEVNRRYQRLARVCTVD